MRGVTVAPRGRSATDWKEDFVPASWVMVIGPIMRLPSTRRTSRPLPPAGEACASS
jgi:hypothetical protein